ncbi:hypothetical protein [Bradyrhizobium sp. AUGA SZCCT0182]|uniref:hypothetical protein n=1 Tax=Bradyrhizobium sp. AUGA SZCCT0182 TaxID=2807667 RepID=UPI001BAC9964|nr:hypothetical protein [Bradyrhizobium sp. AUGA SZCCT0182]MBR1237445.1 hypothetical protein [Bradyrhizobium sp. AUGA SZCCT0182]
MNRTLVFLLLGPLSVVLTTWVAVGMPFESFALFFAVLLFLVTFPSVGDRRGP